MGIVSDAVRDAQASPFNATRHSFLLMEAIMRVWFFAIRDIAMGLCASELNEDEECSLTVRTPSFLITCLICITRWLWELQFVMLKMDLILGFVVAC